MQKPFQINVTNVSELRMGSPYNSCQIELVGFRKINFPKSDWQDKYAWRSDYEKVVFIKLDFENNVPGFKLVLIDTITGEIKESQRISGLVNDIALTDNKVLYNKFLLDREISLPGKLCCHFDEEYEFL